MYTRLNKELINMNEYNDDDGSLTFVVFIVIVITILYNLIY